MKFTKANEVWFYDDGGAFNKRVDTIFRTKWRQAVEAGSLITSTMASQLRQEAVEQATRDFRAEHGGCDPL